MSQDKPAAPDSGKPRSSNSGLIIVLVLVVALLCVGPLVVGGVVAVAGGVFAFWAVDREVAPMNHGAMSQPIDGIEWNEPPSATAPDLSLPAESQPIAPPSQDQE